MTGYIPIILVMLVAFLGGGVPAFIKIALNEISAPLFIALRFVVAGLFIFPIFLYKKEKINKKVFVKVLLISLLAVMNITFFTMGIKTSIATVAQILYAAVPIIVALITGIFYKQKLSLIKTIGIIVGFAGVLMIILYPVMTKSISGENSIYGNLLILIAVISYSLYTVFSKDLQKNSSPLFITSVFIALTIIIQGFIVGLTVPNISNTVSGISTGGVLSILYVGFLGTAVYYLFYQQAIKKTSPVVISMVFYLQPVFTFFWSKLLLGEKLSVVYIIGGVIAFVGAYLVMKEKDK